LESRLSELKRDKPAIAYCAIGGRSRAAAEMLAGRGFAEVYSLAGGIKAWQGGGRGGVARGPQQADLSLLKGDESPADVLVVVFGLEKGLNVFYKAAADLMQDAGAAALMKNLAGIEERHMAKVREMFLAAEPTPQERQALENAGGDTIEGGFGSRELRAEFRAQEMSEADIIDWAMALETQAMDLYLRLAQRAAVPEAAKALRQVGDEEKAHLESLARLRDQEAAA
jgi:rubrerythrin